MKKVFFFLMAISFVIGCNPSKRIYQQVGILLYNLLVILPCGEIL